MLTMSQLNMDSDGMMAAELILGSCSMYFASFSLCSKILFGELKQEMEKKRYFLLVDSNPSKVDQSHYYRPS